MEGFLRRFCNYAQDDWVKWLPILEFCHNNQVNSATGKTAFKTIYGRHPRWDMTDIPTKVPEAEHMMEEMQVIWDEVKASMMYHQMEQIASKKEFKVGDKVWLLASNQN